MGVKDHTMLLTRLERLCAMPALAAVGVTSIRMMRDPNDGSVTYLLTAAKGNIVLIRSGIVSMIKPDTVVAHVLGVTEEAPNPATRKVAFTEWLKTHPALTDAPRDPLKMGYREWVKRYGEVPQCPDCGNPMRLVNTRDDRQFWGCTKWKEAECKGGINLIEDPYGTEKMSPRCPDCGRPMRERDGRVGRFWGCTGYSTGGCRRTIDGAAGDGLLTTVEDWMPRGKGGLPATSKALRGLRPDTIIIDDPPGSVDVVPGDLFGFDGPTPTEEPEAVEEPDEGGTSLDSLRRRYGVKR